MDTIRRIILND
jgi:hypothetical protein